VPALNGQDVMNNMPEHLPLLSTVTVLDESTFGASGVNVWTE
jgi:hypothetical protein